MVEISDTRQDSRGFFTRWFMSTNLRTAVRKSTTVAAG